MTLIPYITVILANSVAPQVYPICYQTPDVLEEYLAHRQSGLGFAVVIGSLTNDPTAVYQMHDDGTRLLAARMTGQALGPQGFTEPYDQPVSFSVDPNYMQSPEEDRSGDLQTIAFVTQSADGRVITVGACGDRIGYRPVSEAEIAALMRCHQGGSCEVGE